MEGLPTFAGSSFLPEVRPSPAADSQIVRDLRAAGAVLAGKTHLFEFAWGLTGENAHYGDCEHPGFPGRTSGGSSSGSAAAVAADIVPFAIGTDTGGSIRVPAAFCGIFGYRGAPHDALISDAFPLAPSFDTAGWFTRSASDMRAAMAALVGIRTSEREPRGCYVDMPGLDPDVASACAAAAAKLAPTADGTTRGELLDKFAPAAEIQGVLGGTAVSYTHLDVYKRQPHESGHVGMLIVNLLQAEGERKLELQRVVGLLARKRRIQHQRACKQERDP